MRAIAASEVEAQQPAEQGLARPHVAFRQRERLYLLQLFDQSVRHGYAFQSARSETVATRECSAAHALGSATQEKPAFCASVPPAGGRIVARSFLNVVLMVKRGTRPARGEIDEAALRLLARHGGQILATARRHAVTPEDAEDAFQRGIEILLTKAPSTSEDELIPWLKTVVIRTFGRLARLLPRMELGSRHQHCAACASRPKR